VEDEKGKQIISRGERLLSSGLYHRVVWYKFTSFSEAIAPMMEAARTSETLVNFYLTARRYNPEDSHLRTHRRENLKSYLFQES
jgi:hypothetical protein